MQRIGRKGHAMFRVVVQDSRRTPTSGKIVAQVGTYDPHSKAINLNKERAQTYLDNGAQPSDRVVVILKAEGIKLPSWVTAAEKKKGAIRHPEKLRRNQPKEEAKADESEAPAVEPEASEPVEAPAEAPVEEAAESDK